MGASCRFPFVFAALELDFVWIPWQGPVRYAVAVTCQDCVTGVLPVLGCWPGPRRKGFSFLFCCYPSTCGVFWLHCWASGCVSEATLVLGDGFSCLSDTSMGEVRVGMNLLFVCFLFAFCFEKLQVYASILGCLWAVSLARSPKAEFRKSLVEQRPFVLKLKKPHLWSSSRREEPVKRTSKETPWPSQINLFDALEIVACKSFGERGEVWVGVTRDCWELIYRERRNLFKNGWP